MAIPSDLKVLAWAFAPHQGQPFRPALHLSSCSSAFSSPKVKFGSIHGGRSSFLDATSNLSQEIEGPSWKRSHQCSGVRKNSLSPTGINQETEGFILHAVSMNFFERLSLAWRILFPSTAAKMNSNANIAKQRLKMILFADRCDVSDEAKQKIVSNIVGALSDFVEIDSQDKVQLSVSTDPDLGTVYSITVPVRRVKAEFQASEEYRGITSIEYKDTGEESGTVDVRFDFFVPGEKESFGF
ncbi:hypothetical protein Taro_006465 [Colocasia esculenta]|uniref:Plastid division regulator MinE n=1 Tax=Colocasia esculenta TaxID=4460 RepID=A0A843TNU3_COLES|nr:hypothetical protein [Colocasia esculenta]